MHGELLALSLALIAALAGGRVAARLGYPSVLGELLFGILLGPPLIGLLQPTESARMLGEFGILLMMVLIGMHLDLSDLRKASTPGLLAAIGGLLVPAGAGVIAMLAFGRGGMEALFVGLAMGVTSLATKSRILVDLKILDTRIAHVLMAGALISDVAVLLVFSAVIGSGLDGGSGAASVVMTGLGALAFVIASVIIGVFLIPRFAGKALNRPDGANAYLAILGIGLLFAWMAEIAGLHAILGAFVGGVFMSERVLGPRVSQEARRRLTTVSVGTLAPLFFVLAGFEVTMDVFRTDLALLATVVVLATVGKILGTSVFYLASGNGWREGIVIGSGMNGRGAVEIIVAEIALQAGIISQTVFSILVFMAIFTTATVPVLLTRGVAWLRRRGELVRAGDRDRILIAGAHPLARALGDLLQTSGPVTLIDTNRSNTSAATAAGMQAVLGNVLDDVTLRQAQVDRSGRFVAATPNPEVNLLAAGLARQFGVSDVTVLLAAAEAEVYSHLIEETGASVLVLPSSMNHWNDLIDEGYGGLETIQVNDPVRFASWPDVLDGSLVPLVAGNGSNKRILDRNAKLQPGEVVTALRAARITVDRTEIPPEAAPIQV